MKTFIAAEKETQPPETASCVLLRGHLSVVPPGLREILRLCLLFKDIATQLHLGEAQRESKLSSYWRHSWEVRHALALASLGQDLRFI